ncbi:MAG: AlpA family phage regulatory protein [Hoeflea sp.]|uniref:helix-turn-helix transcriptional regulator n=1 Tax=Hoeflea sp. TaxID=1940281 RepID=UPI001D82BB81|nr:AlpA family phage regulatory protein [Hoeflea sp.]MBU4529723.1 AlpA family phage regulatory protein [Alphaproteobacteria bacterium]MBU4543284.1 AlpA family phage regulatory protein [Alphaproteobacteria bacterium]MBU4552471.1 AlpA family phage regulatory protein [Alphaproteobacteria bacterium]MBV1723487.1 AlpA family phage regulatory protein [Hoeflea sp.]MBV1762936.1 AlpA family phage regulatory protein [Hoeflea sp.]
MSIYHFLQTCQPRKEIKLEKAANDNEPTLVSLNDACRMTSMSRTMLNRYRAEGRFPIAVELGDRRVAFVRSEVMAWIRTKVQARAAA